MKNDFKLFNNFNMNFNEYEEIPFTENQKVIAKKIILESSKRNKSKYICAALISIIIISSIFVNKSNLVIADKSYISIALKDLVLNNYFNNSTSPNYTVKIKKAAYDNGITVKLSDAILNNNKIVISYIIDYSNFNMNSYKNNFNNPKLAYNLKFFINGKPINTIGTSTCSMNKYNTSSTLSLVSVFNADDIDLNSDINISMSYDFSVIDHSKSNIKVLNPIHISNSDLLYSINDSNQNIITSLKFNFPINSNDIKTN